MPQSSNPISHTLSALYLRLAAVILPLLLLTSTASAKAQSQPFAKELLYKYSIVAVEGQTKDKQGRIVTYLNGGVSINDDGFVAFTGATGGSVTNPKRKENVFVAKVGDPDPLVSLLDIDYELDAGSQIIEANTQRFGLPQINNNGVVLVSRKLGVYYGFGPFGIYQQGTGVFSYLEKYSYWDNFPIEMPAFGDSDVGPAFWTMFFHQPWYGPVNGPFFPYYAFARYVADWQWAVVTRFGGEANALDNIDNKLSRYHSINNNVGTSFSGLDFSASANWFLATTDGSSQFYSGKNVYPSVESKSQLALWSSISDDGHVVAKIGPEDADPIMLYNMDFTQSHDVTQGSGFVKLGQKPVISDDGAVVVFAGERDNTSNTGAGKGVFATIIDNGVPHILDLVVGESHPDLGWDDDAVSPSPIIFSDIDLHTALGVVHYDLGYPGLLDDSFIVSFIGTPSEASPRTFYTPGIKFSVNRGLWTVKVDIIYKNGIPSFKVNRPLPVVQTGDILDGNIIVQDFFLNDPIAKIYGLSGNIPDSKGGTLNLNQKTKDQLMASSHRLAFGVLDAFGTKQVIVAEHKNSCILPVRRMPQDDLASGTPAPWSSDKLDCSYWHWTLGQMGCALTGLAMQLSYIVPDYITPSSPKDFSPDRVNVFFSNGRMKLEKIDQKNKLSDQDLCFDLLDKNGAKLKETSIDNPDAIMDVFSNDGGIFLKDAVKMLNDSLYQYFSTIYPIGQVDLTKQPQITWQDALALRTGTTPAFKDEIQSELYNTLCGEAAPVHVRVNWNPKGEDLHSVIATGVIGSSAMAKDREQFLIADPATYLETLNDWGDDYAILGYLKDPPDLSSLSVHAMEAEVYVRDESGKTTGGYPLLGSDIKQIPNSNVHCRVMGSLDGQIKSSPNCSVSIDQPKEGNYQVTIKGLIDGSFYSMVINGFTPTGKPMPIGGKLSGKLGMGQSVTYSVHFSFDRGSSSVSVVSTTVPSLLDLDKDIALSIIDDMSLSLGTIVTQPSNTIAENLIISQTPAPGTVVGPNTKVNLVISSGGGLLAVPDVLNQSQGTATNTITSAGLTVGTITTQSSNTVPVGTVVSQNPAANAMVASGSKVDLVVSSGVATIPVPDVVGQPQTYAETVIVGSGFTVGLVTTQSSSNVPAGSVISQNPVPDTQLVSGGKIDLVVSSGVALVAVPNVVNQTQSSATSAITSAGLTAGSVTTQSSNTVAAGTIISQVPVATTQVAPGSSVNLVVSSGPAIARGDLDRDGDIDQNDVNTLLKDRNKTVAQSACGAVCDLDNDGNITVLDARKLTALCTRPNCAIK